ncbi:GATA zinc finger domain-containing protein 4-like [Gordionus sp. m RMFG-2023]|uniref:GATA zinc finger domain-containing protein 4-like n=1 Tax=Gordionus sp. m RMFG-2023 TaxID=3053472 RepID=UPI0031FCB75F
MLELGSRRLDSINDKPDIDNISYMNHDKKNKNRNYDNNNNFRYYDRNYGNNNSRYQDNYNNYNYNNYRYNNNNQSNYGRNNTWHDNNQRKQIQYGDGNRNNSQSYSNNSNNYRGSDNSQRKQIQYNNNSNNYCGSDNNNRKQIQYNNNDYNMNIEEKVDSTKNKDDNDFNVNNLSGDMLNDKDNAFMTTLKVNDIVTSMQVDTGSKHTIIPHGLAKKLGVRDVKKSELQLTAYDGNLIKIIGITQVKVTYEGISKYLQAVVVESRKNALLGQCESKLTNGPINKASVKLHLKRDAQPKIIPPRRIPYSKVDLVPIDKSCRNILTISTHKGFYRFTRLPFELKTLSAIFQQIMDEIFRDMEDVIFYIDDLLITGENDKAHLNNIKKVFDRISSFGLIPNLNKSVL